MRVQDIIDKISDETKVDDLLIDLSELAEEENKYETRISELENDVKERDEKIRDLKVDNHELLDIQKAHLLIFAVPLLYSV